jgi:hypothetical protein
MLEGQSKQEGELQVKLMQGQEEGGSQGMD